MAERVDDSMVIDLIVSGYDWICPKCGATGELLIAVEKMNCTNCGLGLKIGRLVHAANNYILSIVKT